MVNARPLMALVDTGATFSTVTKGAVTEDMLSGKTKEVMGFSGETERWPVTKPIPVTVAQQSLRHNFLYSTNAPVALLGRDLLIKLGASILCSSDGIIITFPNGKSINCSTNTMSTGGQWLLSSSEKWEGADIYWVELGPTGDDSNGLVSLYNLWKPWINKLGIFLPPPDPLHCTLYYDRNGDITYEDQFGAIKGDKWVLTGEGLLIGKEGVVAPISLTEEQTKWYEMSESAAPHVSIVLNPAHEARELGSMTKRLLGVTDWTESNIPNVFYSPSQEAYKIQHATTDTGFTTHRQLTRCHGREQTDDEAAEPLIASMPPTLWSEGPTDVGFCNVEPISFSLSDNSPIWVPQYRNKPDAVAGIETTIVGLLESGVLTATQSEWNTPLLPVQKPGTDKYRMVHDLRQINALVTTPSLPVPNPYTALATLTADHIWFTCIDLANAFFCIPISKTCQPCLSFTYRGQQYTYNRLPQGFILSPGLFNGILRDKLSPCHLPEGTILIQ